MRISVVTPCYNYGQYLLQTLISVRSQIKPDECDLEVEHIIMDGGSADGTLAVLSKWEEECKKLPDELKSRYRFLWTSERDKGQTDAINKGLRRATGEIVCWLNSDEQYLPGVLAKVAEAFRRHPKIDLIYGEPVFVDKSGRVLYRKQDHWFSPSVLLWYGCYIASCCAFWRKQILEDGVYLDESYKVTMDFEYWVRLMKLGYKFGFIPCAIASFMWHEKNVSSVYSEKRRAERLKVQMLYGPRPFSSNVWQIRFIDGMAFLMRIKRGFLVVLRRIVFCGNSFVADR